MNRIPAENQAIRDALLNAVQGDFQMRYLYWNQPESLFSNSGIYDLVVDETGYRFLTENHGFSYETYLESFSGKSRKKILNDVKAVNARGVSFRYNVLSDTDHLFRLNIEAFGEESYYYDKRFYRSFQSLIHWLNEQNMLRIVTVVIDDDIAAVDIGAMWNGQCILIAGGTNKAFPGVAKLINLHHIQWACEEKLGSLDFMCGDFGWKERFRLSPSPLYKIAIRQQVAAA
jgi:hypothetical protein